MSLLVLTLLCWVVVLDATSPVSGTLLTVPIHAKPGHIISVLKTKEHTKSQILLAASADGVTSYISLAQDGVLTVKTNVSHLADRTLPLTIQHQYLDQQWKQEIFLQFRHTVPKVQFSAVEYTGRISENEPTGTYVGDLKEFEKSIQSLPVDCVLTMESDEVDAFSLKRNSNLTTFIVSEMVFDREVKDLYSVVVKANCLGKVVVYTRVNVEVTDLNDNVPEFGTDFYMVNLKSTDLILNKEILQVKENLLTWYWCIRCNNFVTVFLSVLYVLYLICHNFLVYCTMFITFANVVSSSVSEFR